jgi:flagellar hook-basal body complex protein FliE
MKDLKISEGFSFPIEKGGRGKKIPDLLNDFKKVLNKAVQGTNNQLIQANQSTQEMVLGEKDIHEAMIDIEKANISFRLMMQVRNKLLSAYEEIMRMQF